MPAYPSTGASTVSFTCTSTSATASWTYDAYSAIIPAPATTVGETWISFPSNTAGGGNGYYYATGPADVETEESRLAKVDAGERAERLLLDNLNEAQRVMYARAKKIIVKGQETGDEYEISLGRSRNIRVLGGDGKYKRTLCAHPAEAVPNADTVLAQKLMLECAEREFLRIANVS